MKLTPSRIELQDDRITIDGRDVFGDLLMPVDMDAVAKAQALHTSSLPDEDTKPGYVIPANIVTVSGSA